MIDAPCLKEKSIMKRLASFCISILMLLILLSFKMKSVPLVGVGISELTPVSSPGVQARRTP